MKDMIIKGDWSSFLDLEGEELLFVKRRHPFVIIYPLFFISLLNFIFSFLVSFLFTYIIPSVTLLIASMLLIVSLNITIMIYAYIYWYFHLYILTTRKILEVKYTPLFSHIVNDIFLDKVSCTEIDLSSKGFFNELIDMGDLTITFDRPTHQEEFVLKDMKDCDALGKLLTKNLMAGGGEPNNQMIWMKARNNLITKPSL